MLIWLRFNISGGRGLRDGLGEGESLGSGEEEVGEALGSGALERYNHIHSPRPSAPSLHADKAHGAVL